MYIEEGQPVLDGLQGKTAENQDDAEDAHAALREMVGIEFDVRIDSRSHSGDDASHKANANGKGPGVREVMDEGATDERRDDIAEGAEHRCPELTTGKARAAISGIVDIGTDATRIGHDLASSEKNSERDCEPEPHSAVQSRAEAEPPNHGKERFPTERIMIEAASCPVEFNRYGHACRDSTNKPEKRTEPQAKANPEDNGIGNGAGEPTQRAVLTAEQVVREVEATQDVQTRAGDTDGRECVVVHVAGLRLFLEAAIRKNYR